jgi:F420-dependent hydroxymycolic acid dehydrogenase
MRTVVADHLQPWQDNEGHAMFPWLTLALVGQNTSHVTFGTAVTCPIYRYHPATVPQAFASLSLLTPERVFLGIGTGERLNEQAPTHQFGSYQERPDRLIESIQLIRQLWTGRRVSFKAGFSNRPAEAVRRSVISATDLRGGQRPQECPAGRTVR